MTTIETQTDIEYTYDCPICMDECLKLKDLNVLECGHFVCRPCGVKASTNPVALIDSTHEIKKLQCPMCRNISNIIIGITLKINAELVELQELLDNMADESIIRGSVIRLILNMVKDLNLGWNIAVNGHDAWERTMEMLNSDTAESRHANKVLKWYMNDLKSYLRLNIPHVFLEALDRDTDPAINSIEQNYNGQGLIRYNPYIMRLIKNFTVSGAVSIIPRCTDNGAFNLVKYRAMVKIHIHYEGKSRPKCLKNGCESKCGTDRKCPNHPSFKIPCCMRCEECPFCSGLELKQKVKNMLSELDINQNILLHPIIYPNPQN